jgi:bud site selection protein 31
MPAIRHSSKRKAPPEGFSDIETDLLIFSNKMKDAENAPSTNVPRHAAMWPIFQISHQRSRYVYELYYEKEGISKELYEWLLKNGYADAQLIAKWKREGYEKVRFMLFLLCSCGFERESFVLSRERGLWSSFLGNGC